MGLLPSHIALITRVCPRWNFTSSTPATDLSPLTSLVFIAFPNALSAPLVPPSDPSFHYFVVDTTSSTSRVNPTTSSILHPVISSDQSQYTTPLITMTSTALPTSAAAASSSSSASVSRPSSSASETSTEFSSMYSSTHATTSVISGIINFTTSSSASSVHSTSSSSGSPPTTRPSTTTPPPPTPSSSPSPSALPTTPNTSSFIALPPPSSPSADIPVTTVLASTTIFITSTNSMGQVVTSAPPVVTEVITTTGSGGIATTVTQAVVNPTLAQNNNATGGSSFFDNTGAVVGVFVVVGLASASIMLWILFAIRRRQRMRRTQDDALEAAVNAAGLNRTPLDDDNEDGSPVLPQTRRRLSSGMGQRGSILGYGSGGSESLLTSARASEPFEEVRNSSHANYHPSNRLEGYTPARTTSPAQVERPMPSGSNDYGSSRGRKSSYGHTPTYSAGSFEPLLANYGQNPSEQGYSIPPTPLPRDSQRIIDDSPRRSANPLPHDPPGHPSDEDAEDKSQSGLRERNSSDSSGSVVLRDNGEQLRPVLVVRNIPDSPSEHSV